MLPCLINRKPNVNSNARGLVELLFERQPAGPIMTAVGCSGDGSSSVGPVRRVMRISKLMTWNNDLSSTRMSKGRILPGTKLFARSSVAPRTLVRKYANAETVTRLVLLPPRRTKSHEYHGRSPNMITVEDLRWYRCDPGPTTVRQNLLLMES